MVLILCFAGWSLWSSFNSYTRTVKANWGIDLPQSGANEIFGYSEPSFHGDGIRYHVIDYPWENGSKKTEKTASQLESIFSDAKQPTESQIAKVEQLMRGIDTEEDLIPDWSMCSLLYQRQGDGSELFLFFSSEEMTIYIVENFL